MSGWWNEPVLTGWWCLLIISASIALGLLLDWITTRLWGRA